MDLAVTLRIDMNVSEQYCAAASTGNQIIGLIRIYIAYKEKELIIRLNKSITKLKLMKISRISLRKIV